METMATEIGSPQEELRQLRKAERSLPWTKGSIFIGTVLLIIGIIFSDSFLLIFGIFVIILGIVGLIYFRSIKEKGDEIEDETVETVTSHPSEEKSLELIGKGNKNFCQHCGHKLIGDAKFCEECGKKL